MEKTDYIITETAPPRVAGRLVQPGGTVQLTDDEARLEILNGSIRLPDAAAPDAVDAIEAAPKARKK